MHPRRNFNGVSGSNNSRGRGNATRGGRVHNRGENSQNRRYHSRRGGNENRRKYDQERRANITIKSKEQALKELECKLNPKIYDLDKKLFSEINKYSTIFKMVSESFLDDEFATKGFILICKVYSQPQIVDSTNKDIKSTIYSRFFENDRFIFANIFSNVLINMLADESDSDNIKSILALFYTLFKVCKQNANKLTREIHTLKKIKMKIPEKYQLSVNEFLDKADKVLYSVYDNNSDESDDEEVSILESTVAPNASDLFGNPRVPKNHVDSGYDNVKKYLNVLYALTKENFYLPIRTHLAELRQDKLDYRDLYLYENVRVKCMNDADILSTDYRDCNLFLSFQIRTPVNCKQKVGIPDWKHTERLGNRSLLILSDSPDCNKIDAVCRSCALARANDRDISRSHINLLNNGVVPVTLMKGEILENKTYYMFEPASSFSAIQPVLQRLMRMDASTFPNGLLNQIVKIDFSYNKEYDDFNFDSSILVKEPRIADRIKQLYHSNLIENSKGSWILDRLTKNDKDKHLRVDHEQYNAMKYALSHQLTLVNGAPGTGKTHFAREYMRLMNSLENQSPIVVITYTNHALDAFLEGILPFVNPNNFIRWGGPPRTTNPIILSRQWQNKYLERSIKYLRDGIVKLRSNLKHLYNMRTLIYDTQKLIREQSLFAAVFNFFTMINSQIRNATKSIISKYPFTMSEKDFYEYNTYQQSHNQNMKRKPIPEALHFAIECFINGRTYHDNQIREIYDILSYNRKIHNGIQPYENIYAHLQYKEEEEEGEGDRDGKEEYATEEERKNEKENSKIHEIQVSKKDEEEEEEENDTKIYGDEDIIAMMESSYEGSNISATLPFGYQKLFEKKFHTFISGENCSEVNFINYLKEIKDPLSRLIKELEKKLEMEESHFFSCETRSSGFYLKKMKLIAMTSTVASVRKEALEVAGCEIMLIEEAGELTESMTSCILPKTLKRLILIGDYQQLRPKVEHQLTFKPYHYDISLFEKLVVNAKSQKADCLFTLSVQRRMHPDICRLIRHSFYQEEDGDERIVDDVTTNELGIPYGIPYRVRFFMHDYKQSASTGRSYSNQEEAKFCAALVPFFICRGYKPSDITIISLYKGQRFAIVRELENIYEKLRHDQENKLIDAFGGAKPHQINVVVLDNFQGEENKIIIVSLTRSDQPGFVKNRNRALVTLSRAREMLIVLGNRRVFGPDNQFFPKDKNLWMRISTVAQNLNPFCMSDHRKNGIAINKCEIHDPHDDMPVFIQNTQDLLKYRFSFCKEKCTYVLPDCGHSCCLKCHHNPASTHAQEHENYICQELCKKKCVNNHPCRGICGRCKKNGCPKCTFTVHYKFEDCPHETDVECYIATSGNLVCKAKCGKRLSVCGHSCTLKCGHDGKCECNYPLTAVCGNCHRELNYICGKLPVCKKKCIYTYECGHKCNKKCFECYSEMFPHQKCPFPCDFILPCGHKCSHSCSDPFPQHHHFTCNQTITIDGVQQICSKPLQFPHTRCRNKCEVCKLKCKKPGDITCIERCQCRCQRRCNICNKQCRSLSGEKCAIFCPHHIDEQEPPEEIGLIFLFHENPNHWLTVHDALNIISRRFEIMKHASKQSNLPVSHLYCPCGDQCREIVRNSWLLNQYILLTERYMNKIEQETNEILSHPPTNEGNLARFNINWYICKCGRLFYSKYQKPNDNIYLCPRCRWR